MNDVPPSVIAAATRGQELGFEMSCEPAVGRLLAALAAAVPSGGRVLELGTGVGYGLAWIVHGLEGRDDVEVVTVDVDAGLQDATRSWSWPSWVRFELGDGAELVTQLGSFDLVFADAPGGKLHGLDRTVAALRPGGILVVDDMAVVPGGDPDAPERVAKVRGELASFETLVHAELPFASGVILSTLRS